MRGVARLLLILLVAATSLPAYADPTRAPPLTWGIWRNPKNTVHLEIKPCGGSACGYVVWATPAAQADAAKGGTKQLIGMQLFREFQPDGGGVWHGKVFVPDLNITLSGRAVPIDASTLKASGCLLGKMLCKSQIWVRIA